jgi:SAM-dependent methyltransferase
MFDWQGRVGQNWAREHERTDRSFAGLTTTLVDRIVALAPRRVLDIGCGAGETSIAVARRCPDAEVVGIDFSEALVTVARQRDPETSNLRFETADASRWSDASFEPDVLISRHGVMFFDRPVEAFENLRNAAAPGARLVFSCFRARSENAWATAVGALIGLGDEAGDPTAPGPFAFADPHHVEQILQAAGWTDIGFAPVDWDYVAGAGDDPAPDAADFFRRIGPAASAIAALDGDAQQGLIDRLIELARRHLHDGQVSFAAAAWVVTATGRAN